MIRGFEVENGHLRGPVEVTATALWLDLFEPTQHEEETAEALLAIDVPTHEEMHEIEASSRLYVKADTAFMTAVVPIGTDGDQPLLAPVTFVLTPDRLVTVRYHDSRALNLFPEWAERTGLDIPDAETLLVSILETIVDRLADLLERVAADVEATSHGLLRRREEAAQDYRQLLEDIGGAGELTAHTRNSLLSLGRLSGFLAQVSLKRNSPRDLRERIKTLSRDVRSLVDHADFMEQKMTFLLDAALGMINIQQNATIKIFSVAAVIFLPPTLIASIYGMNFPDMPEIGWRYGYLLALGLMVVSAILPYMFFKRRGWL